jgi:hypothetical protein
VDPFTLIAAANVAFKAIKQGCEMFREGQALVKDVVKTANEVQAIGKEVKGIFGWIAGLFSTPNNSQTVQQTTQPAKKKQKQTQEFDPNEIYSEIGKNITAFFKAYNALKNHILEEEEQSKTVYDPTGNQTEKAVQRVLAMSQMEAMGVELREYMVYHVPPELKDLYTRINTMIGTIDNEQAIARQSMLKKQAEEAWQQKQMEDKIWFRTASTVVVLLVAIYLVGLMWVINQMSRHGGML